LYNVIFIFLKYIEIKTKITFKENFYDNKYEGNDSDKNAPKGAFLWVFQNQHLVDLHSPNLLFILNGEPMLRTRLEDRRAEFKKM